MSEAALEKKRAPSNTSSIVKVMAAQLKEYWANAESYQKLLYITGFLLITSGVFHTGVLIGTGGTFQGDVSFRKAITFGEAFGLSAISLSWFLTFLPKKRLLWWTLGGPYVLATLTEVFLISMQVWRGVPSHFNNSTSFDAAVFAIMGISIAMHLPLIVGVLIASFTSLKAPASLKWAIRGSMLILIAAQVFGVFMITMNSHMVAPAGSMKGPHALALHSLQILPFLAFLLMFTNWTEAQRTRVIVPAISGYIGVTAIVTSQAMKGQATFDQNLTLGILFALSAGLLIIAFLRAMIGLRNRATAFEPEGSR